MDIAAAYRSQITAGLTIYRNDGTYDSTNQTVLTHAFAVPAFVRGLSAYRDHTHDGHRPQRDHRSGWFARHDAVEALESAPESTGAIVRVAALRTGVATKDRRWT